MNTSRKGQCNERFVRRLYESCGWTVELMRMSKGRGGYDFEAEGGRCVPWSSLSLLEVAEYAVTKHYVQVKSNAVGDARRKFQAAWDNGKNHDGLCVIAVVKDGGPHKPKTVKWEVWRARPAKEK